MAKRVATTIQVANDHVIRQRLLEFERRRRVSSLDFFRRYRSGLEDDREENIEWAGWCHMAIAAGLFPPVAAEVSEPAEPSIAR